MKRFFAIALLGIFTALGANAQYRGGYAGYSPVMPSRRIGDYYSWNRPYVGFRLGGAFSTMRGDKYNSMQNGFTASVVGGLPMSHYIPLAVEAGFSYTEKGGRENDQSAKLDYIEIPLVIKYKAYVGRGVTIEPFAGGYAALGVGGQLKDKRYQTATSSFGGVETQYRRGDAGLKFGCGLGIDFFYAELGYELGMTNISHSNYYDAHNGAFTLTVGVNL